MGAEKAAERIKGYMKGEIDIDQLKGPYVVKGIFMNNDFPVERLEVGEALETGYRPVIQLTLDPGPKIEKRKGSYLDAENFSGSAYPLTV